MTRFRTDRFTDPSRDREIEKKTVMWLTGGVAEATHALFLNAKSREKWLRVSKSAINSMFLWIMLVNWTGREHSTISRSGKHVQPSVELPTHPKHNSAQILLRTGLAGFRSSQTPGIRRIKTHKSRFRYSPPTFVKFQVCSTLNLQISWLTR